VISVAVVVQFADDSVDRLYVRKCRWFVVAVEALHDQLPMLRDQLWLNLH
jgi:hypothetical protein